MAKFLTADVPVAADSTSVTLSELTSTITLGSRQVFRLIVAFANARRVRASCIMRLTSSVAFWVMADGVTQRGKHVDLDVPIMYTKNSEDWGFNPYSGMIYAEGADVTLTVLVRVSPGPAGTVSSEFTLLGLPVW